MTTLLIYLATVSTITLIAILRANYTAGGSDNPAAIITPNLVEYNEHTAAPFNHLSALGVMTVTIYHAVPSQTDNTPTITASGYDVAGMDLENIRLCALSRDLLARWGGPINYGDTIYLDLPDPELSGYWQVEDTMAKRWANHIDLLVPTTRTGGKWLDVEAFRVG